MPPGQERSRAAKYREDPDVEFAEVNGLAYAIGFTPNDPRYPTQWQYENSGANSGVADADIDASGAWQVTQGNKNVVIAILDSGIDQSHEDLRTKVTRNINFTGSRTVDDEFGHGTHVAGTAGAQTNNRVGVAGTCPSCSLFNVKVLDATGSGPWSGVASGITWATDNGAKVINMSLGSYAPSQTLEAAVNYAVGKGVVVVAAAGNDGQNWGFYPAAYPNVISVAATDNRDARASFSNYGSNWVTPGGARRQHPLDGDRPQHALLPERPEVRHPQRDVDGVAARGGGGRTDLVEGALRGEGQRLRPDAPPGHGGRHPRDGEFWIHGRLNACRAVGGSGC